MVLSCRLFRPICRGNMVEKRQLHWFKSITEILQALRNFSYPPRCGRVSFNCDLDRWTSRRGLCPHNPIIRSKQNHQSTLKSAQLSALQILPLLGQNAMYAQCVTQKYPSFWHQIHRMVQPYAPTLLQPHRASHGLNYQSGEWRGYLLMHLESPLNALPPPAAAV